MRRALRNAVVAGIALAAVLTGARRGLREARRDAAEEAAADARRGAGRDDWIRAAKLLGLLLLGVGVVGGTVLVAGIFPNRASSGHWRLTSAFFEFATRRSVATHSLGIAAPPLDDPALVLRGAGHFETGCSPCHGNPWNRQPPVAGAMTPPPPYLADVVPEWTPAQLFYIVKHGIKFAGMPAWPSIDRDDEVWAMVAFLVELPRLDAAAYRTLVDGRAPGSPEPAELAAMLEPEQARGAIRTSCGRCHGIDGLGRIPGAFPKLAAQRRVYLEEAMQAYADGRRHSGVMKPVAAGLQPDQIAAIADYYAALPPPAPAPIEDRAAFERGRVLAHEGAPNQLVPSCADCHGPAPHPLNESYPILHGQDARYLELQLQLFRDGKRGGAAWAHVMDHVAPKLTEEQLRDVALYYASLPRD